MKRGWLRLLVSVLIVAACLAAFDLPFGRLCDKWVASLPGNTARMPKQNYVFSRMDQELLFFGSSRCCDHYDPTLIADSLSAILGFTPSAFNAGIDGTMLNHNLCAIEAVLDRYSPRVVVLETDCGAFFAPVHDSDRASLRNTLPFYRSVPAVHRFTQSAGWRERIKARSSMYRYSGKFQFLMRERNAPFDSMGFVPLPTVMTILPPAHQSQSSRPDAEPDEWSVDNFLRVARRCADNGVLFVACTSPIYSSDTTCWLDSLCQSNNIRYVNMMCLDTFDCHPDYFSDPIHLNATGAGLFSSLFAPRLRALLDDWMRREPKKYVSLQRRTTSGK